MISYTDFSISDSVPARWLALSSGDLIKSVVAELVHEAVLHGGRGLRVNTVDAIGVIVVLLDLGENTG